MVFVVRVVKNTDCVSLKVFSQNIKPMKLRCYNIIVSEGQYERVHMQCCPKHFYDSNVPLSVLFNMDSTIRCIPEVWLMQLKALNFHN